MIEFYFSFNAFGRKKKIPPPPEVDYLVKTLRERAVESTFGVGIRDEWEVGGAYRRGKAMLDLLFIQIYLCFQKYLSGTQHPLVPVTVVKEGKETKALRAILN